MGAFFYLFGQTFLQLKKSLLRILNKIFKTFNLNVQKRYFCREILLNDVYIINTNRLKIFKFEYNITGSHHIFLAIDSNTFKIE